MITTDKKIRLIPFTIQSIVDKISEIPKGVSMINAPQVWENNQGEDVVIAVIDTGIDMNHPDLNDVVIDGYNFTTDDPTDYHDENGHGTHVAGTIAAIHDGQGVVGVAPKAKLLILKTLDRDGSGTLSSVIAAIEYAIKWRGPNNERVRIISMSLGGPDDEKEHQVIKEAINNDILVVCAAGNEGDGDHETDEFSYPAAYPEVVSVGAVTLDAEPADFTNSNAEIDLVAPGVDILSTYLNSQYATFSGTSMAAPHVSGAAALILNKTEKEFGRRLTEAELYAQLVKHTTTLNLDRRIQGNGLLDLLAVPTPETGPKHPTTNELVLSVSGAKDYQTEVRNGNLVIKWE